ncbi:hypothetical protein [Streptomyces sp. Y7]|uniref:hypothetical protein n=1 Tax=Streptomyces sp. Y7 TaxID=3342392 RepID=UPI00372315D0
MTWPATLPGAAARVLRVAAGRRALQLVLVAGGLLAIALLGGERAYAADGSDGMPVGASSVSATSAMPRASAVPSASASAVDELRSSAQRTVERLLSPPAPATEPDAQAGPDAQAAPDVQAGPDVQAAPDAQVVPGVQVGPSTHDKPTAPPAEPALPGHPVTEDRVPQPQLPRSQAPDQPVQNLPVQNLPVQNLPTQDQPAQPHTPRTPAPQPAPDDQLLTPVTGQVGRTVGTQVVRPVGDVVRTVTGDLAAGLAEVQAMVPPLAALPSLPTAPETTWPSWPGWELPAFPGIPDLPGAGVPVLPGQTLPAPITGTPQPGSDAPGSSDGRAVKGRTGKETNGVQGPRFGSDGTGFHAPAAGHAHRTAPSGYAPTRQAPSDHPGGAAGNHAVGDSGTPRHGDAHAVSLSRRVAVRLVPGPAASAEADAIQDRHRDIPVSPA